MTKQYQPDSRVWAVEKHSRCSSSSIKLLKKRKANNIQSQKKQSPTPDWKKKRELVACKILASDRYTYKLLRKLYRSQTLDERIFGVSWERNGKGFNKFDAPSLSDIAMKAKHRGYLLKSELHTLRKRGKNGLPRLSKYWRQAPAA
ncbi:MAG: hypothetical protein IT204_26340 [Fimbriimonadaceae bacterium]|nr:hypothetical protein [Fimbriimonadaceae bacterium]